MYVYFNQINGFPQNVKKEKLAERAKELRQRGDDLLQDAMDSDKDLKGNLTFYSTLFNQVGQKAQLLILFFCLIKMLQMVLLTLRGG